MPSSQVSSPHAPARPRRVAAGIASVAAVVLGIATFYPSVSARAAQAPVNLGTASNFAVLAGSGITNTGATTITGDVGTFPTPSETGFGSVTLHGTDHGGDAVTQQAKNDLTVGFVEAAGSGPPTVVATELGGTTLTPGVYKSPTLGITGTLTLDTQGDPSAAFIFQTSSTLITASSSSVIVLDGGQACNVFWQVGSSATLGTTSQLIGNVLAATSITATTGAVIEGSLLAETGAVTLDHNTITSQTCGASSTTTSTTTGGSTTSTTATTSGGSATTAPGAPTSSTVPDLTNSTPEQSTNAPGESTTSTTTTGSTPPTTTSSGAAPPTTARPPLPRTGLDGRLPLAGLLMLAAGVIVSNMSRARRRQASA